jgi:hypothetical protein
MTTLPRFDEEGRRTVFIPSRRVVEGQELPKIYPEYGRSPCFQASAFLTSITAAQDVDKPAPRPIHQIRPREITICGTPSATILTKPSATHCVVRRRLVKHPF